MTSERIKEIRDKANYLYVISMSVMGERTENWEAYWSDFDDMLAQEEELAKSKKEQAAEQRQKERLRISDIILGEFGPKGWNDMNGMEVLQAATKATICARKIMGDWNVK
jgi:hypothetical protein